MRGCPPGNLLCGISSSTESAYKTELPEDPWYSPPFLRITIRGKPTKSKLKLKIPEGIVHVSHQAFCDNEKLEKPVDKEDARRILTKISGSKHVAITGVCIIKEGVIDNFSETSFVEMDKFEDEKIEELVNNPNTYLYAGGYCIDDNIEGYAKVARADYNNVMGLPLETVALKIKGILRR